YLHIGLDARALPIRLRDVVDRARERDADEEVIVHPAAARRMRAASGRFPDDRRALGVLHAIREVLRAGEGSLRGQDEDRLADDLLAGHIGPGPALGGLVLLAVVDVVEPRPLLEQVRGDEVDHFGVATPVVPQVDDERVDIGEEIDRSRRRRTAHLRRPEEVELQVADVRVETLRLFEAAVVVLHARAHLGGDRTVGLGILLRQYLRRTDDAQVLVVADRL